MFLFTNPPAQGLSFLSQQLLVFQLIWIHFWQHLAVRKGVSCRLKLDVFHGVVFNDFSFSCTRFNSSSALGGRGKNTLIFLNRHKMRTQSIFNNCALGELKNLDDQKLQQMQCWQKKPFNPALPSLVTAASSCSSCPFFLWVHFWFPERKAWQLQDAALVSQPEKEEIVVVGLSEWHS